MSHALSRTILSIRELASLIVSLVATFPGVQFGPLHYRTLKHNKNLALQQSNCNFDDKVLLSPGSRLDHNWWVRSLPMSFRKIDHDIPQVFIHTDASQVGWEAAQSTSKTQGLWTFHESKFHSKTEVFALKSDLQSLLNDSHDTHISYFIHNRNGQSQGCKSVAKDIWDRAITRRNWLSTSFIPGKQNVTADQLSRSCTAGT